ncbi:hypothetical protein [Nocardia iowensis]|nr:hypothetical protein [Nocardia iowensis]
MAMVLSAAAASLSACISNYKDTSSPCTTANADNRSDEPQDDSDKKAGPSPPPPSSSTVLAKPSVQQLNDRLTKALDPNVPDAVKVGWIQAAERDPHLVANLVDAAKKQNAKFEVIDVQDPKDGKLKADAKLTIGGSPVFISCISFVSEDDGWKIGRTFACNVVKSAEIESDACQE